MKLESAVKANLKIREVPPSPSGITARKIKKKLNKTIPAWKKVPPKS